MARDQRVRRGSYKHLLAGMEFIAQPEQPCLQGPGEGELAIYEELTALEESSDASAGCLVGERPVALVVSLDVLEIAVPSG